MVSVALAVDDNGVLAADPELELIGIPESDASGEPMAEIALAAVEEAFASLPKPRRRDPESVAEAVRRAVRSAIAERWNKADLPCSRAFGVTSRPPFCARRRAKPTWARAVGFTPGPHSARSVAANSPLPETGGAGQWRPNT
jgi:hypothetical protein